MFLKRGQFKDRVGRPLELEDGKPPGMWSAILYSVCAFCVLLIAWSFFAEIREIATTKGELTPDGNIKTVSHYEGGIVEEILFKKGERIKKGQPIVRLHSKQVAGELNRLSARLMWLKLEEIRLQAELSDSKPDFSGFSKEAASLIEVQKSHFKANTTNFRQTMEALKKRISERKKEILAIGNELNNLRDTLETRRASFNIQHNLVGRGHTTQNEYLEKKAALQLAKTAVSAGHIKLSEAKRGLVDDMSERKRKYNEYRKKSAEQLAKITGEKIELRHLLEKHKDQYERLHIRAPIDGIIKDITPTANGAVIQPGKVVAEIVPTNTKLIAEVRIKPQDIGHVKVGDKAELTVTTYDFNVYGKLVGNLVRLSASSFKNDEGDPYFLGEISLEGSNTTTNARELDLRPGMLVEANIVTGSKSILKYILKPIYRSVDVAFSER